jgi:hypothetical protein
MAEATARWAPPERLAELLDRRVPRKLLMLDEPQDKKTSGWGAEPAVPPGRVEG